MTKSSTSTKKATPSWSDVKARLADFDRAGLMGLVQDLYAASKENQAFLHARFALGDDPLKPYKATITQWINPADYRKPHSVVKAKKAISDYKKALGQPEGLAGRCSTARKCSTFWPVAAWTTMAFTTRWSACSRRR